MQRTAVLIVDDDEGICDLVCEELTEKEYVCKVAFDAEDALAKLNRNSFDVALVDIKLPGMSGIDLLKKVAKHYPMTAILMITGVDDINTAVEAMKSGALDYVLKPFTLDKLKASIRTVLENRRPQRKIYNTIPSLRDTEGDNNAKSHSLNQINAIAYGVDAQVDHFDFHSKIVSDKTVELARWLGLPDREIEEWAFARDELYSKRDRQIRYMSNKLERDLTAQAMLGLLRPAYLFPNSSEKQN